MEGGDKWDERVEGGYKGVQECSTGGFKYTDMSLVKSQRMPPEKKKKIKCAINFKVIAQI